MDKNKFLNSQGYTLIELIIVLGIISIMSGFGIAKYNTYTQQIELKNQAKKIVDVIELAKKKAITADLYQDCSDFRGYQLVINAGTFLLNFNCGGTYTTVQNYPMTNNVTAIVGIGNFNFLPLGTATNLTIPSITLKNSKISQCITIVITPIGIVNINDTLNPC